MGKKSVANTQCVQKDLRANAGESQFPSMREDPPIRVNSSI